MSESAIDKSAFYTLSCGLYIVSAVNSEGYKFGCVINTLLQVTSKPAQLLIAINKDNATTKAIEESGRFCASVLAQSATMDLIGVFGFKSSLEIDKYASVDAGVSGAGIPYIAQDTVAYFQIKVTERVDVGTHMLFIGVVEAAQKLSDAIPLTYDYYHNVIKGGTPPKASSYIASDMTGDATGDGALHEQDVVSSNGEATSSVDGSGSLVGWKCMLCGKVIEGYPEGLPEDFKCPVCGVGREFFQKIEL